MEELRPVLHREEQLDLHPIIHLCYDEFGDMLFGCDDTLREIVALCPRSLTVFARHTLDHSYKMHIALDHERHLLYTMDSSYLYVFTIHPNQTAPHLSLLFKARQFNQYSYFNSSIRVLQHSGNLMIGYNSRDVPTIFVLNLDHETQTL